MSMVLQTVFLALEEWQINAVGGLDPAVIIVLLLVIVGAVIWTWRAFDPIHPLSARLLITGLRALALLTGLGLLVQPVMRTRQIRDAPTRLAVLVDVSGSMALGGDRSRLSRARQVLTQAKKDLRHLSKRHQIVWYRFAGDLEVCQGPTQATTPFEYSSKTDLLGALTRLFETKGKMPLDGVVLIGDGADTELKPEKGGIWDTSWAQKFGVPINTVFVGGREQRRDLAIERVDVDSFAFSRSETSIVVTLGSVGLPDREIEAFLWQDGRVVQRRTVQLIGGKGRFTFTVFPSTLGQHVLTVTLPIPKDDEVPKNNRAHVAFEVIRDKFRILHLAGQPSWDQRFLREALKSWPRVDFVSFYILRTAYQSTALGSEGMALIPFPTEDLFEEHINEFDVIIFHNFEPGSVGVDQYLDKIADFVREGGAIVLIGGDKGLGSSKIARDALKEIFPVKMLPLGTSPGRLSDATPFRVRLTDMGVNHPMMRLLPSPKKNAEYWRSLSRLDGIGRVASLLEGAFRLAEHPFIQADDGPAPVIAVKETQKGRALAIATDSLWRWRFTGPMSGGPKDAYTHFWRNAISWLTRAPNLDRLRVEVTPSPVQKNKPAKFDIELLDQSYRPVPGVEVDCRVSWIEEDGAKANDEFTVTLDKQGRYRRDWMPKVEGPHRLAVTSHEGLLSDKQFLVAMQEREFSHLEPDESLLKAIAETTRGRSESGTLTLKDVAINGGSERHVIGHKDIPLWDHPIAVLFLIGFLVAEWILRNRLGLR